MVDREEEIERELGRKRLMMRLPALRDQLRSASGAEIEAIFIAYERASAYQDWIRGERSIPGQWTAYHDKLVADLEEAVRQNPTAQRWQDFS